MALGDVRKKVLHLLVKLGQKFGIPEEDYHKIDMTLTHQEIANMIGSTREVIKTCRMSIHVNLKQANVLMEA